MTRYLVDSSAWLFVLRTNPVEPLRRRIDELLQQEAVATTGMIRLELLSGTKTRQDFDRLAFVTGMLHQLPADDSAWLRAAELAFALRRQGITLPNADILIAAVAVENGAILLHADAHFERIARHSELKTESYVKYLGTAR
ncbi:MAG: type II toxin-antitoxin system VapC family toxin [Dehalococcoidia bacterium]